MKIQLILLIIFIYIALGITFIKYLNRPNGDYAWRIDDEIVALVIIILLPLSLLIYFGHKFIQWVIN